MTESTTPNEPDPNDQFGAAPEEPAPPATEDDAATSSDAWQSATLDIDGVDAPVDESNEGGDPMSESDELGDDFAEQAAAGEVAPTESSDEAFTEDVTAAEFATGGASPSAVQDGPFSDDDLLSAAAPPHAPEPDAQGPPDAAFTPGGHHVPPGGQPGYGAAPPVRRLFRSTHDRKLGGVFAGIAEYFNVDPTIVRLLGLVLAFTGVGVFAYVAAWLIVPERPNGFVGPSRPAPTPGDPTLAVALGIIAFAIVFGIVSDSWELFALMLIGGGIWLLSNRPAPINAPGYVPAPSPASAASDPATTRQPFTPSTGAYETTQVPVDQYSQAPYQAPYQAAAQQAAHQVSQYPAQEAPRPRQPQRVTWIVISLLLILVAVGAMAASGDWWDVNATRLVGVGLVMIGIGVVVGQLQGGGARGLIPLGLLAAITLIPVSVVGGLIDEGIGESTYRPTTITELQDSYEHGIGKLTVDLSQLELGDSAETVDIDLGIGELIVIVSDDAGGDAVLQAKAGEVSHQVLGTNGFSFDEGANVKTGTLQLQGDDGTLHLTVDVGFGTAELRTRSD